MKNLGSVVISLGSLVFIYALVARYVDRPTIGFGVLSLSVHSGLLVSNSLMLLGIAIKLWGK